jgi:hypothetical protein
MLATALLFPQFGLASSASKGKKAEAVLLLIPYFPKTRSRKQKKPLEADYCTQEMPAKRIGDVQNFTTCTCMRNLFPFFNRNQRDQ